MKRWLKNNPNPMLGKRHSEETIQKIREGNLGKKRSEETRKRISEAKKGIPLSYEVKKGSESHWYGRNHSPEARIKISLGLKGNKNCLGRKHTTETKKKISESHKGEKSYSWQGGTSFEPYGVEFNNSLKKRIRERDNYTCQNPMCGKRQNGKTHSVHHIDYNKRNNTEENLIALCTSCNVKANLNRESWKALYSGVMNHLIAYESQTKKHSPKGE